MKKILILMLMFISSAFAATTIPSLDTQQSANTLLAGPTSGGAAISSFRALVSADIPAGIITNAALAGSIDLTSKVTGVLPIANGGTNSSTALTNNQVMYSNSGAIKELGAMTDGQIIVGKSSNAPQIVTAGGDIGSITNAGVFTIANLAITNAKIAASTIDLTAKVTGILPGANGGTNNGFMQFNGPATSLKTYTLPNATCNILTDNAAVTVAQGGTGLSSGTSGGVPTFTATGTLTSSALLTQHGVLIGGGSGAVIYSLGVGSSNTVLHGNTGADPSFSAVSMSADVTGTLGLGNGGTGQTTKTAAMNGLTPCTTKGDIEVFDGTNLVRLGVGPNTQVLSANSATSTGLQWVSLSGTGDTASYPLIFTLSNIAFGTTTTPTVSNAAYDVIIGASALGQTPFGIQTKLNNTVPAMAIQNSVGTNQFVIDNSTNSNADITESLQTSNTASIKIQSISENVVIAAAASSNSATNLLPANAIIFGVSYRVTTIIPTATTFKIGDSIDSARYGTGISTAATTTSSSLLNTFPLAPYTNDIARTILITPNVTPGAGTGTVRVTVFYITIGPPGS